MRENMISINTSLYLHKAWKSVSSIVLMTLAFHFWLRGIESSTYLTYGRVMQGLSGFLVPMCLNQIFESYRQCSWETSAFKFLQMACVIFSTPALKLHPVCHCVRCSGFLVYFTQHERSLVVCGWAKAGDLQASQLLSYGCVGVKWGFVFLSVSPYLEKWPLCFHVPPLKQFSVLLRFCSSLSHNSGKYLSRRSSATSLVAFEILNKCGTGVVVGTFVDLADNCSEQDESVVETSSFPSESPFQCKWSSWYLPWERA